MNIEGLSPQESLLGGTEDKVVEYQVFEVIFKEWLNEWFMILT